MPDTERRPLRPDLSRIDARMAAGHLARTGHALAGSFPLLGSDDRNGAEIWGALERTCCTPEEN